MLSSIAGDVGYLVTVPLAGLLYVGLEKNPLIGMCAAFAGVSVGLGATLIPATPADIAIGAHARIFSESQNIPFTRATGKPLTAATMHYWFNCLSAVLLSATGWLVTILFVAPKLERRRWIVPAALDVHSYQFDLHEKEGWFWALAGAIVSSSLILWLTQGPLAGYYGAGGKWISPWLDNSALLIALFFGICGVCYGTGTGRFCRAGDIAHAMVRQMNTVGYILLLTFLWLQLSFTFFLQWHGEPYQLAGCVCADCF